MKPDDTVKTSRAWRLRHPRSRARGVGRIVRIDPCLFGAVVSVCWDVGRYEHLSLSDLVPAIAEDKTQDVTVSDK